MGTELGLGDRLLLGGYRVRVLGFRVEGLGFRLGAVEQELPRFQASEAFSPSKPAPYDLNHGPYILDPKANSRTFFQVGSYRYRSLIEGLYTF